MLFFKRKPKSFLGIDIGASAIKLVELKKENERYQLKNYAIFSLESYLQKAGYKLDSKSLGIPNKEIAVMIKRAIQEAKIESKEACFSAPVRFSFSTLIDFPQMPDKQIAEAVPFEARKYVPVPISEVALDWSIVDTPNSKAGRQVVLIAVPKELISNYMKIADLLKLKTRIIEEETLSLHRAIIGNDKSTIVLIDAGARSINVCIIDKGYVRMSHNVEMGGANITRKISRDLGISLAEAEKIKKELSEEKASAGGEEIAQLKGIVNSVLGSISLEIKKMIELYQEKYNRKIEHCIVIGQGAQLFGFKSYLSNKLGLNIGWGDPFARVVYPPALKPVIKELGSSLAVAIGLAMR